VLVVNVDFVYSYGGNLGRVQGVGYVNELLARLTGQPVRDHTQTNRTLDASPETFPLDRNLYADFSHDNEMVAIYSALGLFRQYLSPDQKLDPAKPSPLRTWILSSMVPFSARMVVERLQCTGSLPAPLGTFVRILVNDAVQPLEFCGGVAGLCELHAFVASQWYARHDGDGDFEKCYD
jgi:Histidine phosphatase superfamily (branch 2)